MKHRTDPASEFARLDAALQASVKRVADGELVDTSDLARDIEALCEQLAATPADGARHLIGNLQTLLTGLEQLESTLRERCEEFHRRIELLAPDLASKP